MPCRSDYMNPQPREVEASRVLTLIDELNGAEFDEDNFSGYHPEAYNKGVSQESLDKMTADLCRKLKEIEKRMDIAKYSLELQMWWRDHKKADRRHEEEDKEEKRLAKLRKAAADRLTVKQREALGIDERGNRLRHTIEGRIPF